MFYFVFISQEASKSTGHSKLLAADHNEVFEVMVEDVSPRYWEEYLANKADYMKLLEAKTQNHCELIASWRFIYGDVNFRAMHLFKYSNVRQRPSKKKSRNSYARVKLFRPFLRKFDQRLISMLRNNFTKKSKISHEKSREIAKFDLSPML